MAPRRPAELTAAFVPLPALGESVRPAGALAAPQRRSRNRRTATAWSVDPVLSSHIGREARVRRRWSDPGRVGRPPSPRMRPPAAPAQTAAGLLEFPLTWRPRLPARGVRTAPIRPGRPVPVA